MDQWPNHADGVLEYDLGGGVMACVALGGGGSGEVRLRSTATGRLMVISFEQIRKLNAAAAENVKLWKARYRQVNERQGKATRALANT